MLGKVTTIVLLLVFAFATTQCYNTKPEVAEGLVFIAASNPNLQYSGRMNYSSETQSYGFDWSGIIISFTVKDTNALQVLMFDDRSEYNVFANGELAGIIRTNGGNTPYTISYEFSSKYAYFIQITRRTEAQNYGLAAEFFGIAVSNTSSFLPNPPKPSRKIEFLGDSITCGYGNLGPSQTCLLNPQIEYEDNWLTYGAMIAHHFNAEYHIECWSGIGLVRNYGSPNITSEDPFPTYFNRTIAVAAEPLYPFNEYKPNAVVINLGTNDYSTNPTPPQNIFEDAYHNFIKQIRQVYGDIPIFLVCGPMIGNPCCQYVQNVVGFQPNTYYINLQNLLESWEIGCNGHPNVDGHKKMAFVATPVIQNIMGW